MGLWVPIGASEFAWSVSNIDGVRPLNALGQPLLPAINSKGSWSQVLSPVLISEDIFGLRINFNSGFVSATARDMLADIGIDPSGGSSYSVLIPDLLASCAAAMQYGGINYYFPIRVPAGSSIAARASVNSLDTSTVSCWIQGYGRPRDPRMIKAGSYVTAYGVAPTLSAGTPVDAGTTDEGAWTTLGTISRRAWWWQLGMGFNATSMGIRTFMADLAIGDASNKRIAIQDHIYAIPVNTEQLTTPGMTMNTGYDVSSGTIYARLQASSFQSGSSVIAYGLGG
jgi:hypothetical protein